MCARRGAGTGTSGAVASGVSTTLRSYDYVNHSYATVRDALRRDARGIFQRATTVTADRADSLTAQLHARIGPLDVAAEIALELGTAVDEASTADGARTRLTIEWHAARHAGWFPVMRAVLSIYPLTSTETQLDLEGQYDPPAGVLGRAIDAVAGHRIAEASVQQFVREVATTLRAELART